MAYAPKSVMREAPVKSEPFPLVMAPQPHLTQPLNLAMVFRGLGLGVHALLLPVSPQGPPYALWLSSTPDIGGSILYNCD